MPALLVSILVTGVYKGELPGGNQSIGMSHSVAKSS